MRSMRSRIRRRREQAEMDRILRDAAPNVRTELLAQLAGR